MPQRGGARPGAGRKPGQVSSEKKALAERARAYATTALQALAEIAGNPKAPASARVSAAIALLDRAFGRPVMMPSAPPEVDRFTQAMIEISQRGSAQPIGARTGG